MSELRVLESGSKGFALAAKFFPSDLRLGAAKIYHWCRYCDDAVDERGEDVATLWEYTMAAWERGEKALPAPFLSLKSVALKHDVPQEYALDLLKGMRMDAENRRYHRIEELYDYCYYVAGTVGLMMCHVMGVKSEEAQARAIYLGQAMQMTNIARDVKEDLERGRIYLPINWLSDEGLTEKTIWANENRQKLFNVVDRLINHAEIFYARGREGILLLPLRAAFAISIASLVYREIGKTIQRQGPKALMQRTVVPKVMKAMLVLRGILEVIFTIPHRLLRRQL